MRAEPHTVIPPNPARCGNCTLCCTLMRVEMEPEAKPPRTRCQHLGNRGCTIYADRPNACRGFECGWLASQRLPSKGMPSRLRPDKTGVVLEHNSRNTLIAHCKHPMSWCREPMHRWLVQEARARIVLIDNGGEEVFWLRPTDGRLEKVFFLGVDPATNERLYAQGPEAESTARKIRQLVDTGAEHTRQPGGETDAT
jgi:hypothetical protein